MFTKEMTEIYTIEKKAPKMMADTQGFNFGKPYTTKAIDGNTTIRKIEEAILPHTPDNSTVLVFLWDNNPAHTGWYKSEPHPILLDGRLKYSVDGVLYPCRNISSYHTKGTVEEIRKSPDCRTIIVAQYKEHLNPVKVYHSWSRWYHTNENNKTTEATPYQERYKELKEQAKATREARQRAEYLATDNTAKTETLTATIKALKEEIARRVLQATTGEEARALSDSLDIWRNGLGNILGEFADFKDRTARKDFASVAESEKAYNNIMSMCVACLA